jgi:hypothetical protein
MLHDSLPAAAAEEGFIANEHVSRAQLTLHDFGDKTLRLGERTH